MNYLFIYYITNTAQSAGHSMAKCSRAQKRRKRKTLAGMWIAFESDAKATLNCTLHNSKLKQGIVAEHCSARITFTVKPQPKNCVQCVPYVQGLSSFAFSSH